jgi:hypothetical protein
MRIFLSAAALMLASLSTAAEYVYLQQSPVPVVSYSDASQPDALVLCGGCASSVSFADDAWFSGLVSAASGATSLNARKFSSIFILVR